MYSSDEVHGKAYTTEQTSNATGVCKATVYKSDEPNEKAVTVAPVLILLALSIITLEIGYKRLQKWNWKQKLLTIFLIIFIQLIPVWFL